MLIQVKGRRFCQSRLVPPEPQSLNSGDCFVFVTRDQVFCWQGKFSNVIERSRSAEIAACVLQRKDLGCKGAEEVVTVEEEKLGLQGRENRKFWKCFLDKETASPQPVASAGPAEEDEVRDKQYLYNTADSAWQRKKTKNGKDFHTFGTMAHCMPGTYFFSCGLIIANQ